METEAENNSVADVEDIVASATDLSTEDQHSDETSADDTTDPTEDNPEAEDEELEYEGKKYRIPKELKDGFMMRADHTRKTQEVAEIRKAVEAERQAIAQRAEAQEALISEHAKVKNLEDYIAYYDNVDWDALDEQDPSAYNREWRKYQQMKDTLNSAKTELQTKLDSRLKEQHSAKEQALQETGKTLAREIPGWNREVAQEIVKTATEFGFSQDELLNEPDPRAWKVFHALSKLNRNSTKQAVGEQMAKQAATAPIKTVAGKSPPSSPLSDRADTKAWMEARNKQVRR